MANSPASLRDQEEAIDAQAAELRDMAESLEARLETLLLALSEPFYEPVGKSVGFDDSNEDTYYTVRALKNVSHDLAMVARCVAAGAVPLSHYDEASYVYYDRIEDDPLWGIDYDSDRETESNWGIEDGRHFEPAYHPHELGWWIRTSKRSAKELASLYRRRAWLADCRAQGLDPESIETQRALDGTTEEQEARYRAERQKKRDETESFLRYALRRAREADNIDLKALLAEELARRPDTKASRRARERSHTEFTLRRALREARIIDGIDVGAVLAEELPPVPGAHH